MGDEEGTEKADDDARQADLVGDDLVINIHEGDHHQRGAEGGQDKESERGAESEVEGQTECGGQQLHQWITGRDGGGA